MSVTRIFDLLDQYAQRWPDKQDALAGIVNREWKTYSSKEYSDNSNWISYGLLSIGIRKGDIIATITNNRPEWNFADMAIAQIGAIHLPIFTTLNSNGYEHILGHAKPKAVFVSDKSLYDKIDAIKPNLSFDFPIYSFDEENGLQNLADVIKLGQDHESEYKEQVDSLKKEILPDDWATLIYTSGTTGASKGVMLSHTNLISNAKEASKVFNLKAENKYLSILPLCHVGERMANYQTQLTGCSIYYAESVGSIARDLMNIKPDGFGAVPRILEKVYDKIMGKASQLTGIKKSLFFWAMNLGYEYEPGGKGPWYNLQLSIANKLVFSKWREALGDNVKFIGVGGAALSPRIERVFWAAGIKLLNMYGLTETSPIITINRPSKPLLRLGTVGAPIEDVEVKIAHDGEILCKGPNVMIGYFNNEEATRASIDEEGWFHTGDIGQLIDDKFLIITDRKKEVFKLSNGKYIQPQILENRLKESVLIDNCMVIGEGEKFASAIVSLNKEAVKEILQKQNITLNENHANQSEVINLIKKEIDSLNSNLEKELQLKRVRLVNEEWSPDKGELSPTLKLKRRVISEKYQDVINDIFQKEEGQPV